MIKLKPTDIFDAQADLIVHQVNCKGRMGSGLALQVKTRYPKAFEEYSNLCRSLPEDQLLGIAQIVKVSEDLSVCNLFGQKGYGRTKRYTRYDALVFGFEQINKIFAHKTVAIPYGLGCGLGGGNWNIVSAIIRETLTDCNVIICKKPESR